MRANVQRYIEKQTLMPVKEFHLVESLRVLCVLVDMDQDTFYAQNENRFKLGGVMQRYFHIDMRLYIWKDTYDNGVKLWSERAKEQEQYKNINVKLEYDFLELNIEKPIEKRGEYSIWT